MADRLAPPPLARDERFRALGDLAGRLSEIDLSPLLVYLVDTVAESALPYLAEQFHVLGAEGWRLATTEAQRRALLARAIALHRTKGTPWSIREALKALGFNDVEIEEHMPSNRYDGAISYSGAQVHDAYGWAQFRVITDAGDDQPITAEQTALIIDAINEWKPARCHLVDVRHRASEAETIDVDERHEAEAELDLADRHRWGRRFYDGEIRYDQGELDVWNGARRFDGASRFMGFTGAGARFDGDREMAVLWAGMMLADRQQRLTPYDASIGYDGTADHGAHAPVAEDLPMPIRACRHRRYDGRLSFGGPRYNGASGYAGQINHHGNTPYSGDVVTLLEA
ncbi:MAG: phage tail protein [Candidatus Accumulibacter sp.]|jgi:phage tail P2-like protein|nr:phage tail protein [Accumulibacter sp.]